MPSFEAMETHTPKRNTSQAWWLYWAFIAFVAVMAGLSDPGVGLGIVLAGLGIGMPVLAWVLGR